MKLVTYCHFKHICAVEVIKVVFILQIRVGSPQGVENVNIGHDHVIKFAVLFRDKIIIWIEDKDTWMAYARDINKLENCFLSLTQPHAKWPQMRVFIVPHNVHNCLLASIYPGIVYYYIKLQWFKLRPCSRLVCVLYAAISSLFNYFISNTINTPIK